MMLANRKLGDGIQKKGGLIVFEGADNSGKTTASERVMNALVERGIDCLLASFPGRIPNTLGAEVYAIHHNQTFRDTSPLSLQLLHVAAHIDSIQRLILPALRSGKWVVLDRYWWSVLAYGRIAGVSRDALDRLVELELLEWSKILPKVVFLFERRQDVCGSQLMVRQKLEQEYREIADLQSRYHEVEMVDNNGSFEKVVSLVVSSVLVIVMKNRCG